MNDASSFMLRQEIQYLTDIISQSDSASDIAGYIYDQMVQFQKSLPDENDVALSLVLFGNQLTVRIEGMGYIGNNLIVFYARDSSNKPLELIQHIHQLNFLMQVARRPKPELPRRPIGFVVPKE